MKANAMRWVLLVVAAVAVGCAEPPNQAIESADQALNAARQAEASDYAPAALAAAEDARRKLDAELAAQQEKFALMRSYKTAEQLATEVTTAADQAASQARAEKQRQGQEVTQMLATAREELVAVDALLDKAPRTKGTKADLAALSSDLAGVETALNDAGEAIAAERFREARAKVDAANESMAVVRTAVEAAMQARQGRT
jgi:hypothetical protein